MFRQNPILDVQLNRYTHRRVRFSDLDNKSARKAYAVRGNSLCITGAICLCPDVVRGPLFYARIYYTKFAIRGKAWAAAWGGASTVTFVVASAEKEEIIKKLFFVDVFAFQVP